MEGAQRFGAPPAHVGPAAEALREASPSAQRADGGYELPAEGARGAGSRPEAEGGHLCVLAPTEGATSLQAPCSAQQARTLRPLSEARGLRAPTEALSQQPAETSPPPCRAHHVVGPRQVGVLPMGERFVTQPSLP